jgi:hypothetical protein
MWKPKGPRNYVKRIVRKVRQKRASFLGEEIYWWNNRSYARSYNPFFSFGLYQAGFGTSILDALQRIAKPRQIMRLLEDGAGEGVFLGELKQRLSAIGISTETTALSLASNEKLSEKKKSGKIDNIRIGNAEFFIPAKPFDAIFSLYGSINYADPGIQKEHLLKFAHSLKRNGLMLVGLDIELPGFRVSFLDEITRAFEKQGFFARFYKYSEDRSEKRTLPHWILIVKRLK